MQPLEKAHAMSHRALAAAKGDVERLDPSWGTIQAAMYAEVGDQRKSELSAKFVLEGEGRTNEGWTVCQICSDF